MRFASLIAFAALAAPVYAQRIPAQDPGKSTKDENIEYTSRSSIPGSMSGRLATHLANGYYAGTGRLRSYVFNSQDQLADTQESFTFEVRAQDPTTGYPDWPSNPGSPLLSLLITNPPGSGIAAWQWTVTAAAPGTPVSGQDGYYLDWLVPANAAWTNDGVSIQMGSGSPHPCGVAGAPACCGPAALPTLGGWERPRGHQPTGAQANIENLAPADTQAGPIAYAGLDRQYFHWVGLGPNLTGLTNQPALLGLANDPTAGGPAWFCAVSNPNRGAAAMDPDVNDALTGGRFDDIGWEVRGGATYANGLALVFNTLSVSEPGLPTPFGTLWVNPFEPLFSAFIQGPIALAGDGVGNRILDLTGIRALVANDIGNLHSQALVINQAFATFQLSNLHAFRFALAGGTTFSIDAANPGTGSLTFPGSNIVQNGGPGHVTYRQLDAANNEVSATLVRERTGRRIDVTPGATQFRVTTANTNANNNNRVTVVVK